MTKSIKIIVGVLAVISILYGSYNLINNALDKHLVISLKETFIQSYNGYLIQCKDNIESLNQCDEWADRLDELAQEVKYLESKLNGE